MQKSGFLERRRPWELSVLQKKPKQMTSASDLWVWRTHVTLGQAWSVFGTDRNWKCLLNVDLCALQDTAEQITAPRGLAEGAGVQAELCPATLPTSTVLPGALRSADLLLSLIYNPHIPAGDLFIALIMAHPETGSIDPHPTISSYSSKERGQLWALGL